MLQTITSKVAHAQFLPGIRMHLNAKFGNEDDCKWKPWHYKQRLLVAKEVSKFKSKLKPNLAISSRVAKTICLAFCM
jgi:hypothetical protein